MTNDELIEKDLQILVGQTAIYNTALLKKIPKYKDIKPPIKDF